MDDLDKAKIRLKCLSMVIENGSNVDRANPEDKAEQYYNFIVGNTKVKPKRKPNKPAKKKVKVVDTSKEEVVAPESIPFPDSGRKKVLLS